MMSAKTAVLLSIRPQHARNILNGSKTVELRRTRPRIQTGDLALVYVTRPVCAVVAAFTVGRVVAQPPEELWFSVRQHAGVDRRQYDTYYAGATIGTAIFVANIRQLPEPLALSDLKEAIPGFRPPRSYRYVSIADCGERILSVLG
jgi:predicted transcriptional regulator